MTLHVEINSNDEQFKMEFTHLCKLNEAVVQFYGIDPKIFQQRLYDKVKNLNNTGCRSIPPNYRTESISAVTELLSENEQQLLKVIPGAIKNDPDKLLNFLENNKKLKYYPYVIDKLKTQALIWQKMRQTPGYEAFPFDGIYRFVIDGDAEKRGSYAFENEPGYILSTFKGLLFALNSTIDNEILYCTLHDTATNDVYSTFGNMYQIPPNKEGINDGAFFICISNTPEKFLGMPSLSLDDLNKRKFMQGYRDVEDEVGFGISKNYDSSGLEDLRQRTKSDDWFKFEENEYLTSLAHASKSQQDVVDRAHKVFDQYSNLINKAKSPIEKILSYAWLAREVEIHHFFNDGNGRSSLLLITSLIHHDPTIPKVLFHDPNVFDAYGPEKLTALVIDAMENLTQSTPDSFRKTINMDKIRNLRAEAVAFFKDNPEKCSWQHYHDKAQQNIKMKL